MVTVDVKQRVYLLTYWSVHNYVKLTKLYVIINALTQPILCKRSLDKSVLVVIVLVDFAQWYHWRGLPQV